MTLSYRGVLWYFYFTLIRKIEEKVKILLYQCVCCYACFWLYFTTELFKINKVSILYFKMLDYLLFWLITHFVLINAY